VVKRNQVRAADWSGNSDVLIPVHITHGTSPQCQT